MPDATDLPSPSAEQAAAGTTVRTTCPYCGVGCGVTARVADDGGVTVTGDKAHPANKGRLCSKGAALAETIGLERRLLYPEIDGRRAGWDEALGLVADRFRRTIDEHGPEAVAFYVSGQLLTEDYYVANKLMKGFIGAANIDTNSRLCMASTVAGQTRAFGADVVPGCYEDLEQADLVVLVGSNLAWCHPVLYQRLAAAKAARPDMRVVVVDPRRTATSRLADLHLAVRPDGDGPLFNALLRHLVETDAIDHRFIAEHTEGFAEALAPALSVESADAHRAIGVDARDLETFLRWFAETERTVTVFSQGVNQSVVGTDKVNAIVNCHLATGRIGRPGMGPFSVTGQPNAMGGREAGGLANQLAAHMRLENPDHRRLVESFWRVRRVADKPGLKAVDLFQAVADGRIKALWIMATNPADSLPDADAVERALAACPFVVVSDITGDTDTVRHAHVRLPATGWGEKDGTVTNSERRISRQRAFLRPPGEARPDWWIVCQVARRLGWASAFDYGGPAAIFREHAALSAFCNDGGRRFDIGAHAGATDDEYDALAPFQWPAPKGRADSAAAARMFADGGFATADGRARFVAVEPPAAWYRDGDYPLVMNTGRIRDQWHTMTRTGKAPSLGAHIAEPYVALHPRDAAAVGVAPAALARVDSPRGHVLARALVTDDQAEGAVFMPMHWNDQFAANARIGKLLAPLTDPVSGQPGAKRTAVRVRPYAAAWYGFAVLRERPVAIAADYWALSPAAGGWRVELAGDAMPDDWAAFAGGLFGRAVPADGWLAYEDPAATVFRYACVEDGRLVGALFVAGEPVEVSRAWAARQLSEDGLESLGGSAVLAGRAGAGRPDPGPTVCACFEVGRNQIVAALADPACTTVEAVGAALRAGTNCGSCRAEIQGIIDVAAATAVAAAAD